MRTVNPPFMSELETALIKKQSFSFGDPRIIVMTALAPRASVARTMSCSVFILPLPRSQI